MIDVIKDETDDSDYLDTIQNIVNGCAHEYAPTGVYITRIKGWFDHKWLNFSGKVHGELAVWKSPLTLPPFNPRRVLSQKFFCDDEKTSAPKWTRLARYQPSSQNLRRHADAVGESVVLVWFCSDTRKTGRGSLMVYVRTPRQKASWFVSFDRKEDGWCKTAKNIPLLEIERLEAKGSTSNPNAAQAEMLL